MSTLIIANGDLDHSPEFAELLDHAGLVIAVDGGANHCVRLDITPDIVLGDLDSIDQTFLTSFKTQGIAIQQYPPRKDATDLELALDLAIRKGSRIIWLAGVLGGRWDMSLANILLAASDRYKKAEIFLRGRDCSMHILHPGKIHQIHGKPDQQISFLPLRNDVHGVTLSGFEYPLTDQTISFGSTLAVSNILRTNRATVQHTSGVLLCVLTDKQATWP